MSRSVCLNVNCQRERKKTFDIVLIVPRVFCGCLHLVMEMWENALQKMGNVYKKWETSISTQL